MLILQRKYFDNLCTASHTPEIQIIQMAKKHYKWENRFPTEGIFFLVFICVLWMLFRFLLNAYLTTNSIVSKYMQRMIVLNVNGV